MKYSRRDFLKAGATAAVALTSPDLGAAARNVTAAKPHLITLSFDDGFRKSFLRTAEIHEKFKLQACLNVVAAGFPGNAYTRDSRLGDFVLWNELKRRGHEVMPHGYHHENLQQLSLAAGQDAIQKCLEVFSEKLAGFDARQAIFNFPYNASTPELETWLAPRVRAFRTGGPAINPRPHQGQVKLTCVSSGPENCEAAVDREIQALLKRESGWLIFNTHGLDDEGWGPIGAAYLERLLERLLAVKTVELLPAGRALAKYVDASPHDK